jgi:uncharacterized protein YdaU (DUF1376 family)
MPDNKPPAFQFYPGDFLASGKVNLMSMEEIGCYIVLLCHQWQDGSIPSEITKLARLCRTTPLHLAELWDSGPLSECFPELAPGRLANPRLERVRQEQIAYRAERAESGRKGAESRWNNHNGSANGSANGLASEEPIAKNGSSSSPSSSSSSPASSPSSTQGNVHISRGKTVSPEHSLRTEQEEIRARAAKKKQPVSYNGWTVDKCLAVLDRPEEHPGEHQQAKFMLENLTNIEAEQERTQ